MKHIYLFLFAKALFLFGLSSNFSYAQIMIGTTQVDTTSIATGLDTPWEILWGPDNHIWITERRGVVSRLNPKTREIYRLLTISDVYEQSESGLLGIVLHPDFPNPPYVYLVYNYYDGGIKERVVRYNYNGTELNSPHILLDNIGGSGNHNGSRILIDADYKLFVTTGDASNSSTSQNLSSLSGKILRMNLDAGIPADNPISGSYLWTWGHRNPQGLVISANGKMYSSEHGANNDDELNLIEKGRNYGWPDVQGFCNLSSETVFCQNNNVVEPLKAWTPTLAVAGIDYYNSDSIPIWKNNILMTSLKASELVSMQLSTDGLSVENTAVWFDGWFGRIRDICIAPNGRVFISSSNRDGRGSPGVSDDRIVQIKAYPKTSTSAEQIDRAKNNRFAVYPNPMQANTIIRLKEGSKDANLSIYNMSGQLIFTDRITSGYYELFRNNLSSGIYILKIVSETINNSQPLVVY